MRNPAHLEASALIWEPIVHPVLHIPSGLFTPLSLAKFALSAWFSFTWLTVTCVFRGDRGTRSSRNPCLALSQHSFISRAFDGPPWLIAQQPAYNPIRALVPPYWEFPFICVFPTRLSLMPKLHRGSELHLRNST